MKFFFLSINDHNNQGHFESWRDLCKDAFGDSKFNYLQFTNFDEMTQDIKANFTKYLENHIHLEWIHDLSIQQISEFNELAIQFNFSWSSHMAVSQALRNNKGSNKRVIKNLFNHLKSMNRLTLIWTWDDEFHDKKYGTFFICGVPDYQNLAIEEITCPLCTEDKANPSSIKRVGLAGQLYGYRGVDLIADFARRYKSIEFLMLGKLQPHSFQTRTKRFLNLRPKNVIIQNQYFATDGELNHAINHLSCLIIDTTRYPEPSGIAVRALAFGIPVLIRNNDSYLRYRSKFTPGIIVVSSRFRRLPRVDWELSTKPITKIVETRESSLLKLQEVLKRTLRETV